MQKRLTANVANNVHQQERLYADARNNAELSQKALNGSDDEKSIKSYKEEQLIGSVERNTPDKLVDDVIKLLDEVQSLL